MNIAIVGATGNVGRKILQVLEQKKIPINLELSINDKIVKLALRLKPKYVCLVPEKRKEITTEGGLNINKNKKIIKEIIKKLIQNNIRTSLFINPNINDIKLSKSLGLFDSKKSSFSVTGCFNPKLFACRACLLKLFNFFSTILSIFLNFLFILP